MNVLKIYIEPHERKFPKNYKAYLAKRGIKPPRVSKDWSLSKVDVDFDFKDVDNNRTYAPLHITKP